MNKDGTKTKKTTSTVANPSFEFRRSNSSRPRGMALVMVVAVLAIASILAYALLDKNTMQAEVSSNLTHGSGAEYIAESGMDVGMYYLQWPSLAPASWTTTAGYKLYTTAIPLNDGTTAAFDLQVTANATRDTYTIQATGRPSTSSNFTHTIKAIVTVARAKIPGAGIFGGNITIPARCTFSDGGQSGAIAVQANGTVTNNGTVTGTKLTSPLAATAWTVPTAANVNYYGVGMTGSQYLWTDGTTLGTPQLIAAATLSNASLPSPALNNPASIYYHNGSLTINGALTINGTLIVRGGTLIINSSPVTITPVAQFPALVCESAAQIQSTNRVFTCNGVVYLGAGFAWTGASQANSKLLVNGALVMPSGATIGTTSNGTISVTYTPSRIDVPALATFDQPGLSVKTNSWAQ